VAAVIGATALVTGITGQDGHYLAHLLLNDGIEVHGAVRIGAQSVDTTPGIVTHEAHLTNRDSVAAVIDAIEPDMVFHLAGMSSVAASWEDPVYATEVNSLSTAALLDACMRTQDRTGKPITMVNASSCEIFAGAPDSPLSEATPVRPTSPYGASKALGHSLCQVYRSRGLEASNAILFNHESPRRPPSFVTRKITATVAAIAAGRQHRLTLGDLSVQRDWGWAPDYAEAMYRIAVHGKGDDFVVATGVAHSILDFVAAAFAAAGIEEWQEVVVTDQSLIRPADRPAMVGDATKAWESLGWKPTKSFQEIVVAMVESDLQRERNT
jgi:GDPmannose 4,6-dehydratase